MSVSINGGTPVTIAANQQSTVGIAVDAEYVYWSVDGPTGEEGPTGSILKAKLGGGAPTTLATLQNDPEYLVVDSENVYWTNSGDGSVAKVALDGVSLQISEASDL